MSDEVVGQVPANEGEGPSDGLAALTEEILPALVARLRASRLGELEVRSGDWRIRLRRDPSAVSRPAASTVAIDGSASTEPAGSVARSPAVGYFSPEPSLVVGASVQAGDLLGSVDVLGIAQEVTAPADGIVAQLLAEDGQAVEYCQALVEVDSMEIVLGADDDGSDGEEA